MENSSRLRMQKIRTVVTATSRPSYESPEDIVTRGIERKRKDKPPAPFSRPDHYPQTAYAGEPGYAGVSESQGPSGPYHAASSWHPYAQGPEPHPQQHQHQQYPGYPSHLHGQQGSPPHQESGYYPPQSAAGGYPPAPSWHLPAYAPQENNGQSNYQPSRYPQHYPQGTQPIAAPPQAQLSSSGANYHPPPHTQSPLPPQHYSQYGQNVPQPYSQAHSPPFSGPSNPPPSFGQPPSNIRSYSGSPPGGETCIHGKIV
ncbi:MAG: hypothetical protein LQ337_007810, partial [Flavoplaca oasis]